MMARARVKVTLLGGFEARFASGEPVSLPTKKAQALLAYLGVRPGQSHPRDKLAALLWGEKSDAQARGGLRNALVALRRALGDAEPVVLQIEGQRLALHPEGVEIDAVTFERRITEDTPPALEDAAELYRGDLLLGFSVNEPLFEEWLVAERERFREMALEALARLLAHQTRAASNERAIQTALRLLALDPLQEAVHRTLMRLYSRQGRRSAALKQYQACVGALRRELGTEPEAATKTLYQDLLRHASEVASASEAREVRRSRPRPTRTLAPPELPSAETPLFGRDGELEQLRRLLDEAIRGHGRVASVQGEAGIGKTRLVSALAADAESVGCRVLLGRCHESDSILSFGPWVDACRTGEISADNEILGALHPIRRAELTRLLPEASQPELPRASESALLLFESMAALIEQVAARQPLLLVLEDVHWADETSLRLLVYVSRRVAAWPVLLITTGREEELAEATTARRALDELARDVQAAPVVLVPLSRADTALLVQALTRVGSDARALAQVEDRVWAMSEGNPFVAVEAMRVLDEDGRWTRGGLDWGAMALPASVRELVGRRLDRLGPRSRELAAVAAVIGRRFDFGLLHSAGRVDEREAAEAVEEMVRHRVLQAVGEALDFTHDRVRDVAYERLLPPRRRLLHRAVVEALEATDARTAEATKTSPQDRLREQVEQLAQHAVRGELWEKAVHYLRQAGAKAATRSALQDARVWFEQALGALEILPESRSTLEQAFEIRLELRQVLAQASDFRAMLERLREAESLAERLNDDHRRGRVCAFLTNVYSLLEQLDEALVTGSRAAAIVGQLDNVRLRILTATYLEHLYYLRGEYERVVELATDNIAALPSEWVHEYFGIGAPPSVFDRCWLVMSLAQLGRFAEAARHEADASELAESTHHVHTVGQAYRAAATLQILEGDWAKARSTVERGVAAARAGSIVLRSTALALSAWVMAQLGEASEALHRLRESEQLLERRLAEGIVSYRSWDYHALGRADLLLGRLDEARALGDRAVETSKAQPGYAAFASHLLGDIATHPDRFDAGSGEAHYREALALAEPRGMRPLIAHCHLGLGRLFRRTGKSSDSSEHLTRATAMYREMGMTYWLERVEAELK